MGLTKPRAAQIFNLDYKQSTRVVTVVNIVLAGGAPSSVDSVSLIQGDRILVTGQTTGSQNGIYKVSVVGSGTDGTWIRTKDSDQTGEVEAGVIVMVTEGAEYADTQWKLITNDPIVIGTTALTFTQNYSANSISAGTSNVVVFDNTNVTISSAGTANVLTISNTGISTTGLVSAIGNVTGNFILGNGVFLTGVITSVANINSGNSNVTVVSPGGNITVGVGGVSDVAVFSTTGQFVTGSISATGNITGENILGNGAGLSGINAFSNVTVTSGNSAVANSIADTLTLTAGDGITIVVDSATDTITIAAQGSSEIFVDGADFGTVTEPVTESDDLGLVTELVDAESDLGTIVTSGIIYPDQFVLPSFTTTTLPSASVAGAMIYVTNETGGAVPAFADGTNWRRVTDRAIVS
jgi:hypothetical protein